MSDFTNISETSVTMAATELDSGVDFTQTEDTTVTFSSTELDEGSDFVSVGDLPNTTIVDAGFGEGGFGEGAFGGGVTVTVNYATSWTQIDTP